MEVHWLHYEERAKQLQYCISMNGRKEGRMEGKGRALKAGQAQDNMDDDSREREGKS